MSRPKSAQLAVWGSCLTGLEMSWRTCISRHLDFSRSDGQQRNVAKFYRQQSRRGLGGYRRLCLRPPCSCRLSDVASVGCRNRKISPVGGDSQPDERSIFDELGRLLPLFGTSQHCYVASADLKKEAPTPKPGRGPKFAPAWPYGGRSSHGLTMSDAP
jgi:hypothetical protein